MSKFENKSINFLNEDKWNLGLQYYMTSLVNVDFLWDSYMQVNPVWRSKSKKLGNTQKSFQSPPLPVFLKYLKVFLKLF